VRAWWRCAAGIVVVAFRERAAAVADWISLTNRIARRQARPRRGSQLMHRFFSAIRLATRSYAKRPGFALTALFLIALGIGATTTIFSVVDGVVLKPLPYPDVERLVYFENPSHDAPTYRIWQERTSAYESFSAMRNREIDLTGEGDPERLQGALVDPGFFSMFGARPVLGRLFVAEEYHGPAQAVVLGYGLWQRRFGGDPAVLGKILSLNGQSAVVVGVLDRRFSPPEGIATNHTEIYLPLDLTDPEYQRFGFHVLRVAAVLKPGVSLASAQAELDVLASSLARETPEAFQLRSGAAREMPIAPLQVAVVGDIDQTLYMLLGAVGLLLFIAVANVANLFLARGTDRAREMALRSALGAGRRQLIGQLLIESTLLAVVGGILGIGLAFAGVRAFEVLNPGDIPLIDRIGVDLRVLGFAVGTALATGILFGLAPAWQAARVDVNEVLKDSASGAIGGRHRGRLRNTLVVAEIAIALVLLTGAGLLFNSFLRLEAVDPGFGASGLAVVPLMLDDDRYNEDQVGQFVDGVLERSRALPGVRAASVAWTFPFQWVDGGRCCWQTSAFTVDGVDPDVRATVEPVTDDYFEVLGTPVRGRTFRPGDERTEPIPVILPTPLAKALLGESGADPVGRTFKMRDDQLQVVGVVEPHRHWGLGDSDGNMMYVPYHRFGRRFGMVGLMVRTAGDPSPLLPSLRRTVWAMEPNLPIGEVFTMRDRIRTSLAGPRFYMSLLMTFALVALLLAAGGIYGAMLYSVGQRRRELGIRVALGAGRARVLGMVVGQGALLTVTGVALGIGGAYFLTRTLQAFVFGIGTTDVPTFAAVATILAAIAIGATLLPARRAAEADPVEALRAE